MIMAKHKVRSAVIWMNVLFVFITAGISVAAEYEKVPVLMVHGMGGNSSSFFMMEQYLRSNGYDSKLLYTIDMTDNFTLCSDSHLPQISAKVEEIVSETGFTRIDVIGHSRGGLNLYQYMLSGNGAKRVRNWISIGGSNNMMCFGFSTTRSSDPTPGDYTSYTSIYSLTDELVSPQIAMINGARNISIESASHFTLPMDSEVLSYVLKALQGTGLNDGVAVIQPNQPSAPSAPIDLRVISF
jgi:triacylglycerol lipase